jgi:lysophospholipase L1-like esterase
MPILETRQLARTALLNVGLTLASIALSLAALEGGLRLFWSGYYLKEYKAYARPSPMRGWENRPSVAVDYGEPEFRTTVRHNSWGFRGPEIALEKPSGRCRVLVLGDSFAYGVGVENDETFSAVLEQMEPRLQVLNAGVNGYGTAQELLFLVEKGTDFSPDLVIVSFFWNDVANSYKRPFAQEAPQRFASTKHRAYLRHSYAYRFLSDRLKLLRYEAKVAFGVPVEESELLRQEEVEPAWNLEFALLGEIDRVARLHGARTLVAVIPEQVQVQPDQQVMGLRPEDYAVQNRLVRFGHASEVPILDLLPALQETYQRDSVALYYSRDRHLRANGHRIVARRILQEIRRLKLVPCLRGDATKVGAGPHAGKRP